MGDGDSETPVTTPRIAQVLLPIRLPEAFDYDEPAGMNLAVGDMVAAPLGPRLLRGVVVGLRDAAGGNRPLRPVAEPVAVTERPLDDALMKLDVLPCAERTGLKTCPYG